MEWVHHVVVVLNEVVVHLEADVVTLLAGGYLAVVAHDDGPVTGYDLAEEDVLD